MKTISRVFTASTLAVVAASAFFFVGRLALAESRGHTAADARPAGLASVDQFLAKLFPVQPRPSTSDAAVIPQARERTVRVQTHVLLVSRELLDKVPVAYDLAVPTHHVRPDTAETLNGAALVDDATAGRLLAIAHSGPGNLDFTAPLEDYPEDEDEFDCLSDMFREPGAPLPPELATSVVNGLSIAYTLHASADRQAVVFAPVTLMRADYPAAEIPNTAAHSAKYAHHVQIAVPNGGTLLIDAGPVKANRAETVPSRHLLVLVQPQLIQAEKPDQLLESSNRTPTPLPAPDASLVRATSSR